MKNRHTAIPAVYALIHKWEGLLFLRHRNTGYMDGFLGLPSGHVEPGESLTQALVREIEEGIGVKMMETQFKLHHTRCREAEDGLRIDFFFHAGSLNGGKPRNAKPEKCSELLWVPPPYSRDDIVPEIREVLSAIHDQKPYTTKGFEKRKRIEPVERIGICA